MEPKFTEQLERVKRYLYRFKQINDGKIHDMASSNYTDDVYTFFQNCYHLKDWIKNDPECSNWASVESFINENEDLCICADLCNALKHLSLTSPRSSVTPDFSGSNISLNINDGPAVQGKTAIAIKYNVSIVSGEIDAFQLAKRCVATWEGFISNNIYSS